MALHKTIDLSIVIPFSRPREGSQLLGQLTVSSNITELSPCEVILVTSTDIARNLVYPNDVDFPIRIVCTPHLGAPARRNIGAAAATGKWVLFMDDDVSIRDWLLRDIERHLTSNAPSVMQGMAAAAKNPSQLLQRLEASHYHRTTMRDWQAGIPQRFAQLDPRLLVVERRLFAKFKFDRGLIRGAEGHDLLTRLMDAGHTPRQIDVQVSHAHRSNLFGLLVQRFSYGRGRFFYLSKRRREAGFSIRQHVAQLLQRHYQLTISGLFSREIGWQEALYALSCYTIFWLGFAYEVAVHRNQTSDSRANSPEA